MTVSLPSPVDLPRLTGTDLGVTGWVELDQHRISRFADATGDLRWVHVDPGRAANGPFGSTVAHCCLILALVPALLADLIRLDRDQFLPGFSVRSAEFPSMVRVNRRVRLRARVTSASAVDGRVAALMDAVVEQERDCLPACVATVAWSFGRQSAGQE